MDRLSFYRSFYETELKKRDDLDKSINSPIIFITIIFGIISYISEKLNFQCLNNSDIFLIIFITIISILLCKSIFHIILSYNNGIKGYNYEILGTNTDFESYREKLIVYYENEETPNNKINKEYEESIIKELVKCSDINSELNIRRSYQIYLTKKYLIISLIMSFLTFLIHLLKQLI